MKKLLLLIVLLPCFCSAQQFPAESFAENRVDAATHDTIQRTYWQVMERSSLNRKLNTFYRISRINGDLYMDLKIMEAGRPFVVPRGAELRLLLENGYLLILHSTSYKVSCAGCGARGFTGSSVQGTMLTFEISKDILRKLKRYYISRIGINTGDDYLEKRVTEAHGELFMDQLWFVINNG